MATPPSPPITNITFPRRQWATRDSRLTLALAATAGLVWPPSESGSSSNVFATQTVPATRVAQLARAGRLWVGLDGRSVRLGVKATLGGKACLKSGQLEQLRQKVGVWGCSLGLVLVDREGESRGNRGDLVDIVLSHPPMPDGLYAPHGIPHARLDRVDCQLRFNFCAEGFDLPAPLVKRQTAQKGKRRGRKPKAGAKPNPKPAKFKPAKPAQSITNPDCLFDGNSWNRTSCLIDAAMATFIGIQGRQVGARALDKQSLASGAPSLLDIAPAAWSNHIFRQCLSRGTHVPLIYRTLATFTNAQSPSLRRKAEVLARVPATADQPSSQEALATRIEEILLKGTLFEPMRLKPVKRVAKRGQQEKESQAELSHLLSPEATTAASSQESRQSLGADMEVDKEGENCYYDLDMGNLEHAFDLSQGSVEEGFTDDNLVDGPEAGEDVNWGDIEAWTEDGYEDGIGDEEYEYDDGDAFQDFNGCWSPLGYWDEDMDEQQDGDGDGEAGWEDIEDGQLEAALAFDSQKDSQKDSQQDSQHTLQRPLWCESDDDAQFMDMVDIGELGVHAMVEDEHADEGIGMWHWRNEHEMVDDIL